MKGRERADSVLGWARRSALVETSDQGHAVSAVKGADGWRYVAWSPIESPELDRVAWLDLVGQEHYPRGTAIRQRSRMLGVFESAADARAACESTAAAEAA